MSKITDRLINNFQEAAKPCEADEFLKVNTVISKAALVYEKIRNAVDYQEEHLVRKHAILRMLKRKLILEKVILENYLLEKYHQENLAEHLLQELIRGGYLKEKVPIKMVEVVDKIITKYNLLFSKIREVDGKLARKHFNYFLEMAAVDIEAALIPPKREKALVNAMFNVLNPAIEFNMADVDEKEKELQVYLVCHRMLLKWDVGMLRTILMHLYYPGWKDADDGLILKIANNYLKIIDEIEKQISHPWQRQLQKALKHRPVAFWVLQDVINANLKKAAETFSDREQLETEIKKALAKRYKEVSAKLRRGVVRSIIYVFFTKMILALALEFPMDWYLSGVINYTTLGINIIFPPLLMFFVAIMIRMPRKENSNKITAEIMRLAFRGGEEKPIKLKAFYRRGRFARFIFNLIYTLTFVFSLMVIFWGLNKLEFNVFSSLIFVLFLTLVSFFGMKIRRPVQDLLAVERRDNVLTAIIDFFAMPFVSMGRWLSGKFSKINVIAMFLDLIIDAPFKLLIEVLEDMFGFVKEKKEEIMVE